MRRYLWLPLWAMELDADATAAAELRVQGHGRSPFPAQTAQLPARLPVMGVDCVVRWLATWTLADVAQQPPSRFLLP